MNPQILKCVSCHRIFPYRAYIMLCTECIQELYIMECRCPCLHDDGMVCGSPSHDKYGYESDYCLDCSWDEDATPNE